VIGFDLLRPGLLGLLVLGPLVLVVGLWSVARRRRDLGLLVAARQLERFLPELSFTRARARVVLASAAALFLAFAAVGPVRGYTQREVARRGLDLVLCIDTSRSMLAQDVRPSRLERAKREIRGLFDALRGDRVALLAFSGDVREVAPLTSDTRTLASLLDYVTPEDNQLGGTDLAAALQHALDLFDGRTGAHEAIVLLTDGEDLAGRGKEVALEAQKRGIRVYVVGIGTVEGGKIPVVGRDGRESFLRDAEGKEVVTRLEPATLEELARSTGGEFLSTLASGTPLEDLMRLRISRLEGRDLTATTRRVPHDRFQWPLVLAVACVLGELALIERRGGWRKR
jgi:Ca-activated chloride channel family protein